MSEIVQDTVVRRSVTVAAPAERAFAVFTEHFDSWWPAEHHLGAATPEVRTMEPRVGGRWYERAADGQECDWGRVLAWEPPHRVLLAWQIDGRWEYDPDPAHGSEVEVRFVTEGPASTRVELEHRGIERLGDGWESVLTGVSAPGGWGGILERYAASVGDRDPVRPVRASVTVAAPVERAWQVYTGGYGSWEPKGHFIGTGPAETVLIEPYQGGRWYERSADGSEPEWGRVLAWEPPHRLVLSWMVGGDWQHDPDPAHASEVEVRFVADGPERTRVELEHRRIERHGEGAASILGGVSDEGQGHPLYLRRFAAAVEGRNPG